MKDGSLGPGGGAISKTKKSLKKVNLAVVKQRKKDMGNLELLKTLDEYVSANYFILRESKISFSFVNASQIERNKFEFVKFEFVYLCCRLMILFSIKETNHVSQTIFYSGGSKYWGFESQSFFFNISRFLNNSMKLAVFSIQLMNITIRVICKRKAYF